jgi:hypothetical protein
MGRSYVQTLYSWTRLTEEGTMERFLHRRRMDFEKLHTCGRRNAKARNGKR